MDDGLGRAEEEEEEQKPSDVNELYEISRSHGALAP
jgi:hypothetical protein